VIYVYRFQGRFGHLCRHTAQMTSGFDLQHRGFLLVFHSNYSSKVYRFSAVGMEQTDGRTDGRAVSYLYAFHFGSGL